jgi:hypothetical protein
MSNILLSSDTDSEGKPQGWRHWWDRDATPSNPSSPPTKGEEEGALFASTDRTRRRT